MDVFSVLTLLGGLAFFLYGMKAMSSGLEKIAGGSLEKIIQRMTSNIWSGLFLGIGITALIQSSSAVTVILVGLVNSGIMVLNQTTAVIMGSNIGTTATAWLLSLTGIQSNNGIIRFMKPENFTLVIALIGIIMMMKSKKRKNHDIGSIMLGFSILIYGMKMMSDAVSPLKDSPQFVNILKLLSNPVLGVLIGALFTAILQSHSASIGILQAISLTGSINYGLAIPVIIGQNLGTVINALLAGIGVNKDAKRVPLIHILIKVFGTLLFLAAYIIALTVFNFDEVLSHSINPVGIAIIHTTYNVLVTIVLLPLHNKLEKLAYKIIKDTGEEKIFTMIDDRLLATPSIAILECNTAAIEMAKTSRDSVGMAFGLFGEYDRDTAEKVEENETILDKYEDKLGTYLVKLAGKNLTDNESRAVSNMLTAIGDFERIGDHALNILEGAQELKDKKIRFSDDATREINVLSNAIKEILDLAVDSFEYNDVANAKRVEPLEQVIDLLVAEIKKRHVERLRNGQCTIELGFVLSDFLGNCERISDHCSNIAGALIELNMDVLTVHEYLNDVKTSGQPEFENEFSGFRDKYSL